MPDIFDLLLRWWKHILALVIIALLITGIFVYSKHKEYLGTATALPAPTFAADKGGVFSQNLQVLYPGLGTPDDLDMILGTAHLDTVYSAVADKLNLVDYYGESRSDNEAVQKAGSVLKGKTRVIKSDYGELKVKVWDGDRNKAAEMANAIMEKLQETHTNVQAANNITILQKIKEIYAEKKIEYQKILDSSSKMTNNAKSALLTVQVTSVIQQIQEYEKLMNQYQLMVDAKPQALIIVEKASPALWPDKPKPVQTMIVAGLISFFFGLLVAIVLERRRMVRK